MVGNYKLTIIVDCNYIANTAKHSMKGMGLKHENINTGVIYVFLQQIGSFIKKFKSRKLIFCWDSRTSKRYMMYPEYKANRKDKNKLTEEDLIYNNICYGQFATIKDDVLPSMGFKNIFCQDGYESDDILAALTMHSDLYAKKEKIAIMGNDHDLFQLLSPDVFLYDHKTKEKTTDKDFYDKFGIQPDKWGEVLAISGCNTDYVKGIENVGVKTAIKYVLGKLPRSRETYVAILSEWGKQIIERNKKLVILPFEGTIVPTIDNDEVFYLKNFENMCEKYGFYSFLKAERLIEWRNLLGMR
jgi:DNA polymerase-1